MKQADTLTLYDTVSLTVIRAALLTAVGKVEELAPEGLPPLPVVEELEAEPCVLCQPKGDGR